MPLPRILVSTGCSSSVIFFFFQALKVPQTPGYSIYQNLNITCSMCDIQIPIAKRHPLSVSRRSYSASPVFHDRSENFTISLSTRFSRTQVYELSVTWVSDTLAEQGVLQERNLHYVCLCHCTYPGHQPYAQHCPLYGTTPTSCRPRNFSVWLRTPAGKDNKHSNFSRSLQGSFWMPKAYLFSDTSGVFLILLTGRVFQTVAESTRASFIVA